MAAEFTGVRQLFEILEAEEFEEKRGRLVKKGASGLLGTTGDPDNLAFQQGGNHAIDGDAAHRFHLGPADGLTVGDDGQRFERRLAEAGGLGLIEQAVGPDGEFRAGLELVTSSDALHHQAGALGLVAGAELLHGFLDLRQGGFFEGHRLRRLGELGRLVHGVREGLGIQGSIRGKKQRFDDTGQVHPSIFKNPGQKGKRD